MAENFMSISVAKGSFVPESASNCVSCGISTVMKTMIKAIHAVISSAG